jgi:hypothetical protein
MMSREISQVYNLTEYRNGNTMNAWLKSRWKVISAKGATTLGFRDRAAMKSQRCVRSVSRLTGIRPERRSAKRLRNKFVQ